jgi:putative Mg2+ transporter-C (MgtC) family protein
MILADFLNDSLTSWYIEAICRLLAAALLGAIIGFERGMHGRNAGFRTQLLVALGSALAMVVSLHFAREFASANPSALSLRIDPARMAYGVMGGIGFLGAGVIMRRETGVRGLTTAASLWCTAAVGLACGFGMYVVAAFATSLVVFALIVLNRLDTRIPSRASRTMIVKLPAGEADSVTRLREVLQNKRMSVSNIDYQRDFQTNIETITIAVSIPPGVDDASLRSISSEIPELTKLTIR